MKIRFASVHLEIVIPRLDGGRKGLASQDTSFFNADAGAAIEFDCVTGLVRLSKGETEIYVPLSRVQRFGPVVTDEAKAEPTSA